MGSGGGGRSWLSVVIAILAVTAAGYAAWRVWRPNPFARSEVVVRQFAADARKLLVAHRRSLVAVTRAHGDTAADVRAREAAIDARSEDALESLRKLAETARTNLDELEGLSVGTLRNRLDRLDRRFDEAAALLREEATRAKKEAAGTPKGEPAAPKAGS
jgi:hypothetical protein